ncbi:MAG: phosphatase PAP2 family protein [Sphingobacteriales bacterium]|nr:phosphatase PAP2 family protein [Sphingobacteriales bacterium]
MKIKLNANKIFIPSALCLIILLIGLIFHQNYGNTKGFLIINQLHNPMLDEVFKYLTYLGDGIIWLAIAFYCLFKNQKKLPIVFANFAISTLLAQGLKRWVFPDALRPVHLVQEGFNIHFVEGVKIYTNHSFPSGHAISAFAVAFTLVIVLKRKNHIKYLFLALAFLVGWSRIYLAEHYPIDVIAGGFIGIISTYLTVFLLSQFKASRRSLEEPIIELEFKIH